VVVVLAVDVGSTLAKALLVGDDGRQIGPVLRRPTPIGHEGIADVEAVTGVVDALIDDVLSDPAARPDAVALSCAWHTLVGVDGNGRPTTELTTWLDGRAGPEALALRTELADAEAARQRTGAPIHPSLPPARLTWFRRHRPGAFAATRRWCSLPEALATRWFAMPVGPSPSIASGSGLYDQRRQVWDDELLAATGVSRHALAAVEDRPRHGLGPDYKSRWPLLADVPWFPAVGDGAAAVVGSRCEGPDRAALTVGTSAAVRVVTSRETRLARPLPAALFGYLLDGERAVVGGARSNAGNLVAWAGEVLHLDAGDPVVVATAGREPGGHGLDVDSSLVTERSPAWPVEAGGRVAGLRRTTTAVDLVQALVEDAALGIASAAAALEGWAGGRTLVLGGGASGSAGWRQLLAEALGRPVVLSPVLEASAVGAALVVLDRLGVPARAEPADLETVVPDPDRAVAFGRLKERHTSFAAFWGS
jgi:gluconokinase